MPTPESPAAYFTDRCDKLIDTRGLTAGGPDLTPCRLKFGHDGPHGPIEIGKQTTSDSPGASCRVCGGRGGWFHPTPQGGSPFSECPVCKGTGKAPK